LHEVIVNDRTDPEPIMPELDGTMLESLLHAARLAAASAYCPYSNFHVGAAVLAGGKTFTGANLENASYGLTVCAERTAAFAAVLAGFRRFEAVAVACVDAAERAAPNLLMPCGACRQVLAEFAAPETPVVVDRIGRFRLDELLPLAFRLG
jgi:cytidine deaminase